jgi:hypothetical protein
VLLVIERFGYLPSHTPGQLFLSGTSDVFLFSMEPPWRSNRSEISCIPEGQYRAAIEQSPKHGQVWELRDVPGRTDIQIHILNFAEQTEGCIGVGRTYGVVDGRPGVSESSRAFGQLMVATADETELDIIIRRFVPLQIDRSEWT